MPSSPGGQQPDPAANIQGKNIDTPIEPQPAETLMPSSPAGQQPDPTEKVQGKNVEASIESLPAVSESVETGGFAAFEQVPVVDFIFCSFNVIDLCNVQSKFLIKRAVKCGYLGLILC